MVHTFREANRGADFLASLGHLGEFTWTILDSPPPRLSLVLQEDARGASLPRGFR